MIKTSSSEAIIDFLMKDPVVNQNIIGIIENESDAQIYVDDVDKPEGVFVELGYFHYVYTKKDVFIKEVVDYFKEDGFYGFSGVERSIAEKIKVHFKKDWESRCSLYYLPKENFNMNLIKNTVVDIDIKDAEIIDSFYTYRNPQSIETIKKNILNRPSSAVYVNGEIACWVMVHEDNSMGIMYTKEEHRRRGYAVDVTVDLCNKIIEKNKIPFLQIVEDNNMSPGLAIKCGFIKHGYADWFGIIVGTPKEIEES